MCKIVRGKDGAYHAICTVFMHPDNEPCDRCGRELASWEKARTRVGPRKARKARTKRQEQDAEARIILRPKRRRTDFLTVRYPPKVYPKAPTGSNYVYVVEIIGTLSERSKFGITAQPSVRLSHLRCTAANFGLSLGSIWVSPEPASNAEHIEDELKLLGGNDNQRECVSQPFDVVKRHAIGLIESGRAEQRAACAAPGTQ
jgi:hypothetical protein